MSIRRRWYLTVAVMSALLGLVAAQRASAAPMTVLPRKLACIRHYESHGDYRAVSPGGRYRGAYEFDLRTWRSVGGTGDPAAASPAEQDRRATTLIVRRGLSPWPTTKRRCA